MAEAEKGIRITIVDLATGEMETTVIWDDYLLICAGSCHRTSLNAYPTTGTHMMTVKGVRTRG